MDPLPSAHTETEVRVLGTRRERRKVSSLSVRNESSFHSELRRSFWPDLNQSKIYHRVGIFIFRTLFGYAQTYTQLRIKNMHGSAFSVVLELTKKTNCHWCKTNSSSVTSPTNQNLRWKRHWQFISETTLPRPMWSFEEKEIQRPELTYGMTIHSIKWPPDSLVQTGSLQQSSQGVKQHLSHSC